MEQSYSPKNKNKDVKELLPDRDSWFDLYASKVYGLALKLGFSARDAEDGVQEVFLKLQRKSKSFRGESSFSTWLYRVALNTLRDHRRKVVRFSREAAASGYESKDWAEITSERALSPIDLAIKEERRQLIRKALNQLPSNFREVLVLRELEGLSYRDIANVTGVKQGTIESRIFRARQRLASEISNLRGDICE
jgi:RNA polymerase sigma-70 factor (ECF subfamily)